MKTWTRGTAPPSQLNQWTAVKADYHREGFAHMPPPRNCRSISSINTLYNALNSTQLHITRPCEQKVQLPSDGRRATASTSSAARAARPQWRLATAWWTSRWQLRHLYYSASLGRRWLPVPAVHAAAPEQLHSRNVRCNGRHGNLRRRHASLEGLDGLDIGREWSRSYDAGGNRGNRSLGNWKDDGGE